MCVHVLFGNNLSGSMAAFWFRRNISKAGFTVILQGGCRSERQLQQKFFGRICVQTEFSQGSISILNLPR